MATPSEDKCLNCGNRARPQSPLATISYLVNDQGKIHQLPYWFCSAKCHQKVVSPYIEDKRYAFDAEPFEDPEFKEIFDAKYLEYIEKTCGGIISNLFNPVAKMTPQQYIQPFYDDFEMEFRSKQRDVIYAAENVLFDRLAAEFIHQFDEKIIAEVDQEHKEAEQQKKEDEKQRKIDEAEEARAAEEERWRPKPFTL